MILIDINYLVDFSLVSEHVQEHRDFLSDLYDKKYILLSGPKSPKKGGVILVCSDDVDKAQEIFSQDPFIRKGLADYRYIPFDAVKSLPEVSPLLLVDQ